MKRKLLIAILPLVVLWAVPAWAASTTGGVTWLDTLNYTKPQFYPLTVPDENATCAAGKCWYVDQQNGSGSTCSHDVPCPWSGLSGKAGVTGGPAYIYLKGNARLSLTSVYGSAGNEVVIKPWSDNSNVVTMTATGACNIPSTMNYINTSYVIIDGGPNLLFSWVGAGTGSQNCYTLIINGSYTTVARTRIHAGSATGPALGIAAGVTGVNHIYWINNEMYDSMEYYGVYTGGGANCDGGPTGHSYLYFINNIFRDICGRGIQIETRSTTTDHTYVTGNAFHNVGKGACLGQTSACVQPSQGCSGSNNSVFAWNNIAWDLGGGFFYVNGQVGGSSAVYNNTVYDFAKSTPYATGSHGITCDGGPLIARNNIVLNAGGGMYAFNRCSFTQSNNLCSDGTCTGYSGTRTSEFASYDPTSASHLKLKTGATSIGHGYTLTDPMTGGAFGSYFGDTQTAPFDIGADKLGEPVTSYTITMSPGANGRFRNPSTGAVITSLEVGAGNSTSIRIDPDHGYCVANLRVNSTSLGKLGYYRWASVSADQNVTATFEACAASAPTLWRR